MNNVPVCLVKELLSKKTLTRQLCSCAGNGEETALEITEVGSSPVKKKVILSSSEHGEFSDFRVCIYDVYTIHTHNILY